MGGSQSGAVGYRRPHACRIRAVHAAPFASGLPSLPNAKSESTRMSSSQIGECNLNMMLDF
ncbi:hypothetical protein MLGJGCBP_05051 [Rhodococcus sp. T7]|nr:hypothetical protein MLGJGCBP_05051 [Rhodococcus sp. T7]